MAVWGGNWSSGSDTDESGTSYHSDDSNSSGRMEAARILGETFLFPQGLCDNPDIFKEVLSLETWNNLSEEQKRGLQKFLPSFPENDAEEKDKCLKMLFNRENVRFGNPLNDFHNKLQSGSFRPDLARMRSLLRKAQQKDYKRAERWRIFELLKSVLSSRQRLVDAVINGEKTKPCSPPTKKPRTSQSSQNVKSRYFQELALIREDVGESSQSSEDDNYPSINMGQNKKLRRTSNVAELMEGGGMPPIVGTLSSGPNPWDMSSKPQHNPYAPSEQSFAQLLAQHTKRRANREDHPDLHTDGISLQDVALRCKFLKKPPTKPIIPRKMKMKVSRSHSTSSPAIEEEIVEEIPDFEEHFIKQEDEEESKVDIEALDELPVVQPVLKTPASSIIHGPLPKHQTAPKITSLLLNKKIKLEYPEPASKKLPFEPEPKKSRSDSTESRKSKSDSADCLVKKIKVEHDASPKKVKVEPVELPPAPPIQMETPFIPLTSITTSLSTASVHQTVTPVQAPVFSIAPVKSTPTRIMTPATLSDLDGYDMMDLPVDFDETPPVDLEDIKPHPELMQETQACFFSLIRDILLSTPDHRIEMKELELRVKAWASSPIGPINHWYTPQLESQLASAVLFLAGDLTEALPDDYVPYMEWKSNVGAYQWIGAGRDSDHRLSSLCSLWLERGADRGGQMQSNVVNNAAQVMISPDPPPRGPAVRPTSPRRKELFRQQEKQRYETPYRAYSYNLGGSECNVGPVRSMQQSGNLSKARGHTLLVEDRPKHVTILELVRDAVARLPNSQGTRADIVTLLKDSQYLSENTPENMLSSVVSSALDRLHYEHDPTVKYDTKRKIWMYLHKGRSLEEHERLHALVADVKVSRPKNPKRPPKTKKEPATKAAATETTINDTLIVPDVPVTVSVTDSSTSTTTCTLAVTSGNVPSVVSPLLIQAKPKATLKTTTVPSASKKINTENVKAMLGKTKVKLQESPIMNSQPIVRTQPQVVSVPHTTSVATSPKKTVELNRPISSPLIATRTILQESPVVSTSSVKSQTHTLTKKVGSQTVTLSAEPAAKQPSKSIVKVITSQGTTQSVRTVQRLNQQVSQQQILQLKQQLMSEQSGLLQKAQLKKTGTMGAQQLLVRMQGEQGTSSQGQVIVINQQQILVDSPQLAQQLKQQPKQLQQFLSKQQLQVQSVDQQLQVTPGQSTQTSVTTPLQKITPQQQQQLNQIILNKQQQILIGDQQKGKGQSQMILMKQPGTPVSTSDGTKTQVQQMILAVKPGGDGEGTQITPQQLHQMIVLNKQQNQQQIYMVKPDQKLQMITQQPIKAQAQQLTLAQIQQLQQQQRTAGTSTIISNSRVVAQVSSAPVNTISGATLLKPQVVSGNSNAQMVAKVVSSSQTPVLTMENILAQHKQQTVTQQAAVRLPAVSRPLTSQYVVSLPQTRVVQTNMQQVVATTSTTGVMAVTSVGNSEGTKLTTSAQGVRIPGLNLANIAGKQVLLASKPQGVQGQNVMLANSSGQALLVGGNQQGTVTVLQQGGQQILLPPGVVKTIQGLKVIPLAQGKPQQGQAGRHQMIARISGMRPILATNIIQEAGQSSATSQQQTIQQPSSSSQSKD